MERAPRPFGFSLFVQSLGNGQGVRVEFNHAVYRRPTTVNFLILAMYFCGKRKASKLSRAQSPPASPQS